jgi:predicted cupin superfamily sugar epimerase
MAITAKQIIDYLHLQRHMEGGFFRETYRSDETIAEASLNPRYGSGRSVSTCIYFMLTDESFSAMHRVLSDEIYHFYCGSPLELLLLFPDGKSDVVTIGPDLLGGEHPQYVIPRGCWQGSRVKAPGEFSLIGATVAPGFDFADFAIAGRDELLTKYPDRADLITALTR